MAGRSTSGQCSALKSGLNGHPGDPITSGGDGAARQVSRVTADLSEQHGTRTDPLGRAARVADLRAQLPAGSQQQAQRGEGKPSENADSL